MPANYVLLEKITVGAAGASSVTFSGIPQTGYTDLVVKASASIKLLAEQIGFNTVSIFICQLYRLFQGNGATAFFWNTYKSLWFTCKNTYTANTFSSTEIYIPNYTSSNYKSISTDSVQENNATTVATHFQLSLVKYCSNYFYYIGTIWSIVLMPILNLLPLRRSKVRYNPSNRAIRNRWRYHYD
jgi:hypothetical protein